MKATASTRSLVASRGRMRPGTSGGPGHGEMCRKKTAAVAIRGTGDPEVWLPGSCGTDHTSRPLTVED